MTISSVVDIVHGELLNTPSINRIEQVRVNAKKVKRGDLFISLFGSDIDEALANGAYAVIVPKSRAVADDETAWIGVEDTNQAMLLLLRYLLVQRDIRFIHCDEPLYTLAESLLGRNRQVMLLGDSIINLVDTLIDREEIRFCLSADRMLLDTLASDVEEMKPAAGAPSVCKESLFQTEMLLEGMRYAFPVATRLKAYLATLISFCGQHGLECGWSGGTPEVFHAVYLTRGMKISPVATDRVMIVDRPFSDSYVREGEAFLSEHFKWGRILGFSSDAGGDMLRYASFEDLRQKLQKERFNYAYVLSEDPQGLLEAFNTLPQRREAGLF